MLAIRRSQGNLLEIVERLYLGLRVLNRQHVIVSGLWIDPVTWRHHAIGGHGGDDAVHDRLGRQSLQTRLLPVDV